jgi:hypothetical protein
MAPCTAIAAFAETGEKQHPIEGAARGTSIRWSRRSASSPRKPDLPPVAGSVSSKWISRTARPMEQAICFLAWDIEAGEPHPGDAELLAVKRVPFRDAVGMVERGEIRDAISAASILKVHGLAVTGRLPGVSTLY